MLADPLTSVYRARILEAAGTYQLPVAATYQPWGTDGALMTYGPDLYHLARLTATY